MGATSLAGAGGCARESIAARECGLNACSRPNPRWNPTRKTCAVSRRRGATEHSRTLRTQPHRRPLGPVPAQTHANGAQDRAVTVVTDCNYTTGLSVCHAASRSGGGVVSSLTGKPASRSRSSKTSMTVVHRAIRSRCTLNVRDSCPCTSCVVRKFTVLALSRSPSETTTKGPFATVLRPRGSRRYARSPGRSFLPPLRSCAGGPRASRCAHRADVCALTECKRIPHRA